MSVYRGGGLRSEWLSPPEYSQGRNRCSPARADRDAAVGQKRTSRFDLHLEVRWIVVSGLQRELHEMQKAFHSDLMAISQPAVYRVLMSRLPCLSISIILSLLSVVALAAPAHKRPTSRWHGYGFLPGYHQPLSNSMPLYMQKKALQRMARERHRPWYIDPVPSYYGYDGNWHYFGRLGFYRGRYNGGTFGPCYTRTPIGPIWNCG